jgi:thiamine-phosphate pyrophosphorylase
VTTEPLAHRLRLVVITDGELARPRALDSVIEEALLAGAPAVQVRDKDATAAELFAIASRIVRLTRRAGALCFVNDRMDVALAVGADGVHVGPDDVPVGALRRAAPPGFLIGASTDDPARAKELAATGVDYIGCGAVYATTSKADAGTVIGLEGLVRVAAAVAVPVVGIGGITVGRSAEVAETPAAGVAVIGAVMTAADVAAAVAGLLAPWSARRAPE